VVLNFKSKRNSGSTPEEGSEVKLNDALTQDRDKLIAFNKFCIIYYIMQSRYQSTSQSAAYKLRLLQICQINWKRGLWESDFGNSQTNWKICGYQNNRQKVHEG
jgi:hypothetical protein